jgi:hypothetical protein
MIFFRIKRHNEHYKILLGKFIILSAILTAYFIYLSFKFGINSGIVIAFLTWSFFVLCTPIAEAGLIINFPLRFFVGIRMFVSEIFVWIIAIAGNIVSLNFFHRQYNKTFLTKIFHKIIITPNPYWIIIILSCIGTFLSIRFGGNMYDVFTKESRNSNKNWKIKTAILALIFLIVIAVYYHLVVFVLGKS